MRRMVNCLILAGGMACTAVQADDAPPPPTPSHEAPAATAPSQPPMTRRQMMKECMAKQKASDGGMPKEDMKRTCRDVTATERENEKAEQKEEVTVKRSVTPQS